MIEFLGSITFLFLFGLLSYSFIVASYITIMSIKEFIEELINLKRENTRLKQLLEAGD